MSEVSAEFAGPDDNVRLANLCGALDGNLRQIEAGLGVQISRRAHHFTVAAPNETLARLGHDALAMFARRAEQPLDAEEIQLGLVELQQANRANDDSPPLRTRRGDLQGRTPRQRQYLRQILSHDVTFGLGPAGTGKTYLAVACAVDAFERDLVKRIILTRPAVEAGERLGFLPGDLSQKVDPYLRPLYDAMYDLMGLERTSRLFEKQAIEVAPLAYMRGRTLNNAFIILDEAQNTTPEQMKMFLTRIGFGSRAVVTGDITQIDLPRGQASGLVQAQQVLRDVRGLAFTEFDSSDVVRHPLVARIVDAYERHGDMR
ncbi:MAG: PhoH family protein [Burkholderiaceae bacterium]